MTERVILILEVDAAPFEDINNVKDVIWEMIQRLVHSLPGFRAIEDEGMAWRMKFKTGLVEGDEIYLGIVRLGDTRFVVGAEMKRVTLQHEDKMRYLVSLIHDPEVLEG